MIFKIYVFTIVLSSPLILSPSPTLPQRLSPLLVTQDVSDWWVHHCYGCDSSTHVTHKVNGSRVLIGSGMEYRSEELSSLERSRDYSPIFKVVLRDGQGEEEDDEEPTCRKRGGCCVGGKVLMCGCGCVCVGAGVGGCCG